MLDDHRLERLRRAFGHRPARGLPRVGAAEAAVALVLRPRSALELLVVKRSERESDPWSGHMALPGGRRDPGDHDLLATALRETEEEAGLKLDRRDALVGALDEVRPLGPGLPPIVVAPYVLAAAPDAEARPDAREVDTVLWIPLGALTAAGAVRDIVIDLEEGPRSFPSIQYRGHVIWGLTHRILTQFLELTEESGL